MSAGCSTGVFSWEWATHELAAAVRARTITDSNILIMMIAADSNILIMMIAEDSSILTRNI